MTEILDEYVYVSTEINKIKNYIKEFRNNTMEKLKDGNKKELYSVFKSKLAKIHKLVGPEYKELKKRKKYLKKLIHEFEQKNMNNTNANTNTNTNANLDIKELLNKYK